MRSVWSKSVSTGKNLLDRAAGARGRQKSHCPPLDEMGRYRCHAAGFNARTRVHEYGGGDYAVSDGMIIFSNFSDQRLYIQKPGKSRASDSPSATALRGQSDRAAEESFLSACARTIPRRAKPINTLVSINLAAKMLAKSSCPEMIFILRRV